MLKKIILLLTFFYPLNAFGSCLREYPKRYNYGGNYGTKIEKIFLITSENKYKCFPNPKINKYPDDQFNIKCSDDLLVLWDNDKYPEGTINKGSYRETWISLPKIYLQYKNHPYLALGTVGKYPSSESDFKTTSLICENEYMRKVTTYKYKLKDIDKEFKIQFDNTTLITF